MTAQTPARKADGNGIPTPVVKWYRVAYRTSGNCEGCEWEAIPADLALARQHVKSHPAHHVAMRQVTTTYVWAETTDGVDWAEAVGEL